MRVHPSTWNVPYDQNRLFTGRDDILKALHDAFMASKMMERTQPQAITGLGGIGKTQIAIEYTYHYASEYQTVLWAKADSREVLTADFVSMADLLGLPEKNEQDQKRTVDAVKQWLQSHPSWLLILDNVEDLTMIRDFIPQGGKGHILLTTRSQATGGIADAVEIKTMEPDVGAHFLLRRTKITNPSGVDDATAQEISREMGGLPLALDQAGAYIEETGDALSDYLKEYQTQRTVLLQKPDELAIAFHESAVTTFSLAFDKVKQSNAMAAELLQLCAFLHPDDIPREIITEGATDLGPVLQQAAARPGYLNSAIAELRKYSLVHRDPGVGTLSIHRLVQDIIKDAMDKQTQRTWAERTVRTVNHVFPDASFEKWQECQKYLPHAQKCSELIKDKGLTFPEASRLLRQAGLYLHQRAQYVQAESLLKQALDIREKVEPGSLDEAESLNDLGELYYSQGKYVDAKQCFVETLAIRQQQMKPDAPLVAESLTNLAAIHFTQNQLAEAEQLFSQALAIFNRAFGPEHRLVAINLSNLAHIQYLRGNYREAEGLYRQALVIYEKVLEPGNPNLAHSLDSLALVYRDQGKYAEAEPLYREALDIRERILGPENPDTANSRNNLALFYYDQGKYAEAEPLYLQALNTLQHIYGREHSEVAKVLHNLARLYQAQDKYDKAEELFTQSLEINKRTIGLENREVAKLLDSIAQFYETWNKQNQAEAAYSQALDITKQTMGSDHPQVATVLEHYAALMLTMDRKGKAARLRAEARRIRARHAQKDQ